MKPNVPKAFFLMAAVASAVLLSSAAMAQTTTQIAVSNSSELGSLIVGGEQRTLYLFLPDNASSSTCYDACATAWPPFLLQGDLLVQEGVDVSLLGTSERSDGTRQLTFAGWPLYGYAGDDAVGAALGHGLNDVWFAVAPDGTAVPAAEAEAAEADEGNDDELFAQLMREGATVFSTICAACHGANGDQALISHVAILADNSRVQDARFTVRRILRGGGYMPGFGNVLSDFQGAAVATFVRNSWGNDYGIVTEEDAAGWR